MEGMEGSLIECGLHLALGSIESREATALTSGVVAETTARAVTSSLVTIAVKWIRSAGAFLELASRSSVSRITQASNVLHGIPRFIVRSFGLAGKVLLGPAGATIVAVIGAYSSLASSTFVSREACAQASLSVAKTCNKMGYGGCGGGRE